MIQSFDTQLQVVLRALRDVVAPSLPAGDKQVQEQFALSLAALEFMRARLPLARRYLRADLIAYVALAREAVSLASAHQPQACDELDGLLGAADRQLGRPEADDADLLAVTRQLRESMSRLVAGARQADYEPRLTSLVVDHSQEMLRQERLWCLPLGFELKPEELGAQDWQSGR